MLYSWITLIIEWHMYQETLIRPQIYLDIHQKIHQKTKTNRKSSTKWYKQEYFWQNIIVEQPQGTTSSFTVSRSYVENFVVRKCIFKAFEKWLNLDYPANSTRWLKIESFSKNIHYILSILYEKIGNLNDKNVCLHVEVQFDKIQ